MGDWHVGRGADCHVRHAAVKPTVCSVWCAMGFMDMVLVRWRTSRGHTVDAMWDLLTTQGLFSLQWASLRHCFAKRSLCSCICRLPTPNTGRVRAPSDMAGARYQPRPCRWCCWCCCSSSSSLQRPGGGGPSQLPQAAAVGPGPRPGAGAREGTAGRRGGGAGGGVWIRVRWGLIGLSFGCLALCGVVYAHWQATNMALQRGVCC